MAEEKKPKKPQGKKTTDTKTAEDKPKQERQVVNASTGEVVKSSEVPKYGGKDGQTGMGLRIGAIISWVVALAAMVMAIIMLLEGNEILLYVGIGVAGVLCILAAQLWKRANRIRPYQGDSKFGAFVYNQLGVIAVFVIFLPIGLFLLLKSDKLSKKGKTIATVIFVAVFALASLFSIEYEPPVKEVGDAPLTGDYVYWTQFGYAYHPFEDCYTIARSLTIYQGSEEEAHAEGKDVMCKRCASRIEGGEVPGAEPAVLLDDDDYLEDDSQELDDVA